MKVTNTSNVYSFTLTETEWYAATEQQQEAWINQILREAAEWRCRYTAIFVDPDPVMSMSPIAKRHQVWRHTFPTTLEEDFKADLTELRRDALKAGLTLEQIATITHGVFG